jgi:hypothetical protein
MYKESSFFEIQKFTQWYIWLLILLPVAAFVVAFLLSPNASYQETEWRVGAVAIFLAIVLFGSFKLTTKVNSKGVFVQFFPIHFKEKAFLWKDIKSTEVKTYAPIIDFGGWGVRYSITGKGMAYNVSGDKGLQLELNSGKKVLIGTQKPDELSQYINEVKQSI